MAEQVWLVEAGEYEQRFAVAAFATEALALDYTQRFCPGEEPSPLRLLTGPVEACVHHKVEGVFGPTEWRLGTGWAPVVNGYVHRHSWASDTAHCDYPCEGRIDWWDGGRTSAVYVGVDGNCHDVVEARFAEMWQAVVDGERPPEIASR